MLLAETIAALAPQPGAVIVDATVGLGGHAVEIAQRIGPTGTLVALDQDASSLARAEQRIAASGCRLHAIRANFAELNLVLARLGLKSGGWASWPTSASRADQLQLTRAAASSFHQRVRSTCGWTRTRGEPAMTTNCVARPTNNNWATSFAHYGEERLSRGSPGDRGGPGRDAVHRHPTAGVHLSGLVRGPGGGPRDQGPLIDPAMLSLLRRLRIAVNDSSGCSSGCSPALPAIRQAGGRGRGDQLPLAGGSAGQARFPRKACLGS